MSTKTRVRASVFVLGFLTLASSYAAPPPQAHNSEHVRCIAAPGPNENFGARMRAVHALTANIQPDEIQVLYGLLRARSAVHDKGTHALKNDVMDKLCQQDNPPAGLVDELVGIYQDDQQDVVMRDYAVQHMGSSYHRASAADRARMRGVFKAALREKNSSIAGTSLLALERLSGASGSNPNAADFNRQQVREEAGRLAQDPKCGELTRITAIQVCGRMGATEIVPTALELARNAKSIPLRMSAIATLGDLGGPEVIGDLEALANDSDPRLKTAAIPALQRLNTRLGR